MTIKLQSQIPISLQIGMHTYHVLDIRVDLGGEDIPILKDETDRLCVFSRLLSKVAGYKQKDTLYRMVQRQESQGIMKEGFTHRMEPASEMHALCTRLYSQFPVLTGMLFRVRTPEAMLYSQSFPLLKKLSQLDLQPVFSVLLEVEEALQANSAVSADEALVDELASAFAGTPAPHSPLEDLEDSLEREYLDRKIYAGLKVPEEILSEARLRKLFSERGHLEVMEEAVHDLATSIDVPVEEKFLERLAAKARTKKRDVVDEELSPNMQDLISDADIPQENVWVPPGYPEVFEDITGPWVGRVYAWVLLREADPHKRGVGANIPNIPLLLRSLLRDCGFLEESGNPLGEGRYFIFQEKTGSLQYNREILPKLLCTLLVTNPELDYRAFLRKETPSELNVREVQELAQRLVKEL